MKPQDVNSVAGSEAKCPTFAKFLTCYHFESWGTNIFIPRFQPKTSSCRLPYQCHSSSAVCARELFKDSNGSARLL